MHNFSGKRCSHIVDDESVIIVGEMQVVLRRLNNTDLGPDGISYKISVC